MSLKARTSLAVEKAFRTMASFLDAVSIKKLGTADYDPDTGVVTSTDTIVQVQGFVLNIIRNPTEEAYSEADRFDLYVQQKDLTVIPTTKDQVVYNGQTFQISKVEQDPGRITWAMTLAEI